MLGAGGLPGEAFHRGVLRALEDATGFDGRVAEVIVGTSAGSLVGAALRAPGTRPPADLPEDPLDDRVARVAGLGAFVAAARRPWRARAGVLATSLVPAGRHSTDVIASGVRHRHGDRWPAAPLWIVAVRRRDGRRVVFGRDGSPPADLARAVAASCAIPGFFRPVVIGGEEYVDGGVHSPTNAAVLAGAGLDAVVVSSPMSMPPTLARPQLDTSLRLMWHRVLTNETRALRRAGTPVIAFEPTADVARVMGINAMRAARIDEIEDGAYESTLRAFRRPVLRGAALVLADAAEQAVPA